MSETGKLILECLERVRAERTRRASDPVLAAHVVAVKRYQHQRFSATYSDLLAAAGSTAAARFFLDKLYGPRDFDERDEQFARLIPALTRVFSGAVAETVLSLAQLHALSETLDSAMGSAAASHELEASAYRNAWQQVGRADLREKQVELMLKIGSDLQSYVRKPLMRMSLRMMRGPAAAAGFGDLQEFLESGFDAFAALQDPAAFLQTIASRERALSRALFEK